MEKNLKRLGVFGIISLLSYTAMVVFSPLVYPGYDWLSMAICVGITGYKVRSLKLGIYCFTAMEWVCNVGYEMFPWVSGATATEPQNVMHFIVTILIVALSLAALILIIVGAKGKDLTALRIWAIICLAAMLIGPVGTALLPKTVFGLFERFGTFSVVVFNAVLGISLMNGTLYFPAGDS